MSFFFAIGADQDSRLVSELVDLDALADGPVAKPRSTEDGSELDDDARKYWTDEKYGLLPLRKPHDILDARSRATTAWYQVEDDAAHDLITVDTLRWYLLDFCEALLLSARYHAEGDDLPDSYDYLEEIMSRWVSMKARCMAEFIPEDMEIRKSFLDPQGDIQQLVMAYIRMEFCDSDIATGDLDEDEDEAKLPYIATRQNLERVKEEEARAWERTLAQEEEQLKSITDTTNTSLEPIGHQQGALDLLIIPPHRSPSPAMQT